VNTSSESDRYAPYYASRRRLIACATVIEEMLPFLPAEVPYEVLDFGLHLRPGELKHALQERIDAASQGSDVLLLGYGLCSLAVVGLRATTAALVIPRLDDCIGIFLGSHAAYRAQARQAPGTYYLTKGWIEAGTTPFNEHEQLVKKYGAEKAKYMTALMLKNYTRLAFINTGQYQIEQYRAYAAATAEAFGLQFEEVPGSPELVHKMVFGPWDGEFVVIPPGGVMEYQNFSQVNSAGSSL
jgi:hypothetical protein